MQARGAYGVAIASALATVAVLGWARIPFVVPGETFHAVVETAAGGIAAFAAALAYARFRLDRQARDLALVVAFVLYAVANLGFAALPATLGLDRLAVLDTWGALTARGAGAGAFCAAALLPARRVSPRAGLGVVAATFAALVLVGVGLVLTAPWWPPGAGIGVAGPSPGPRQLFAHPALEAAQLVGLLFYVGAFVGFRRRAAAEADQAAGWLALAAVFAAFARVHYLLYPSLYAGVVYSGDLFRLGFYATVLTVVVLELQQRYEQAAELSVLQERRRLARDLHDGLAQELAFIVSEARDLAEAPGAPPKLGQVASAAERALDESRRAIAASAQSSDRPLVELLTQAAEEVAGRHGAPLRLDLPDADVPVAGEQREMLIRVVREAVRNAARHARAGEITVALSNTDHVTLTISDDGVGFDPELAVRQAHRFGLTSMRERAEAVGARFSVRSEEGAGTTVEVVL